MYTKKELILLRVLEEIANNTSILYKKNVTRENEDDIVFKRMRRMEYILRLNDDFNEMRSKLEMKDALLASPGWGRMATKKEAVREIEYLLLFLREKLEQASQEKRSDYYQFMDKIDDMKLVLSLMHLLPEDFDFNKLGEFNLLKKYSLEEDIEVDDSILIDRSDEY